VRTLGIEELPEALGALPERISEAAHAALGLDGVVALARTLCPMDTGALASSIRVERAGPLEASLVAGGNGHTNPQTGRVIDYAAAVHDGTSTRPPRPFLTQAILIESDAVAHAVLEGVEP